MQILVSHDEIGVSFRGQSRRDVRACWVQVESFLGGSAAGGAWRGLAAVDRWEPDVALTDIRMPPTTPTRVWWPPCRSAETITAPRTGMSNDVVLAAKYFM